MPETYDDMVACGECELWSMVPFKMCQAWLKTRGGYVTSASDNSTPAVII